MPIAFRPVTTADFPQLRLWLRTPHVSQWWGEAEEEVRKLGEHLDTPLMDCFVFAIDGVEAGYIQSYPTGEWPEDPFAGQPAGSRGIDLYLGEAGFLGRGLGTQVIEAFVGRLFAAGVPVVCIDPHPDNARAIRAYEKAGFRAFGKTQTTRWGRVVMMKRERT